MERTSRPGFVLVMGVCGVGKSHVGRNVAERLGAPFIEGDDFHTEANKAHMASGRGLTDAMRLPWLDAVAAASRDRAQSAPVVVLACSALKRAYRDRLRARLPGLLIVHLAGDPVLIGKRIAARSGHFMPPAMLASQLSELEAPAEDEAVTLSVEGPPDELVSQIVTIVEQQGHESVRAATI
jgi:gluconokinase